MTTSQEHIEHCYYCPNLCRHVCPVANADQTEMSTPHAKMSTMHLASSKQIPWSKEVALHAYNCTNCRASTTSCELDTPVASVLDEFRVFAYKEGFAPDSAYSYCKQFKLRNNPYKVRLLVKLKKQLPDKHFARTNVTYFPGCTEIHRDFKVMQHAFQLFEKLDVGPVSVFDQAIQCCGYPLLMAGDLKGFKEHAEVMMHMLQKYPLLVMGSPACLWTFKEVYPQYGFRFKTRFVSVIEFIESYVRQKNFHIRKGVPSRVAYHDPCYMGRYLGIYDAPRYLIETVTGAPPHEFRRSREQSDCCGGGGLLPVTRPTTAQTIAENRLKEFEETGASILVTTCPSCVHRFRRYGKGIQVKNLIELLNQSIEVEKGRDDEEF